MKKLALLFIFSAFASSIFSQITKSEAEGILRRHPISGLTNIYIWGEYGNNDGKLDLTYSRYDAKTTSVTASESGLIIQSNINGVNSETFLPYLYISEIFADNARIAISINK